MNAIVQSLKDMGTPKLALMGGVGLALLGFFLFLAMRGGNGPMGLLYSGLPMDDSGRIVQYLEQKNVPFEIQGGGSQILVPTDRVGKVRLELASQGMPAQGSGVGYEIFDKSEALGTSNFVHNVNMLRALEGELARTISTIQNIKNARVHLVIPKREMFSKEQKSPSASVVLEMGGANELSKGEIQAIRNLVATAVPGLDVNRITIVDNHGNLLARGGEGEDDSAAASEAADYRNGFERRMEDKLTGLLEETVGGSNVKVNVAADLDFNRVVKKSEIYDPNGQVARSVQSSSEKESNVDKKLDTTVSVRNNLPDPQSDLAGGGSKSQKEKSEETTNYEISKTVEDHVQETGTVKRISVAVLVNGTYTTDDKGVSTFVPRSQEELDRISKLVKSSIGYDEKRGDTVEVVSMEFAQKGDKASSSPLEWIKDDMHNIIQTAILGVVAILAIMLVIRPLVTRAIETSAAMAGDIEEGLDALSSPDVAGQLSDQRAGGGGGDGGDQLAGFLEEQDNLIDLQNVEGKIKSSSVKRIINIIDNHPDETLGVIRSWMAAG